MKSRKGRTLPAGPKQDSPSGPIKIPYSRSDPRVGSGAAGGASGLDFRAGPRGDDEGVLPPVLLDHVPGSEYRGSDPGGGGQGSDADRGAGSAGGTAVGDQADRPRAAELPPPRGSGRLPPGSARILRLSSAPPRARQTPGSSGGRRSTPAPAGRPAVPRARAAPPGRPRPSASFRSTGGPGPGRPARSRSQPPRSGWTATRLPWPAGCPGNAG